MVSCNEPDGQSAAPAVAAAPAEPGADHATSEAAKIKPIEMPASAKPAGPLQAGPLQIEAHSLDGRKIEAVRTEAPEALTPSAPSIEAPRSGVLNAAAARVQAAKLQVAKRGALRLDWIKQLMTEDAFVPRGELGAGGAKPSDPPPRRSRKAAVAVLVASAAALGVLAGALGASALAPASPAAAEATVAAPNAHALEATIAQLRADVTALKASVEAGTKNANGQFARIAERFDRIERAQADPVARINKAVEGLERLQKRAEAGPSKETTGSVSAAPTPASAPIPPNIPGWVVRDVFRGVALIQGPRLGLIEVEAGDVIPGIGRIESIRKQDGRWMVTTSRGVIASAR